MEQVLHLELPLILRPEVAQEPTLLHLTIEMAVEMFMCLLSREELTRLHSKTVVQQEVLLHHKTLVLLGVLPLLELLLHLEAQHPLERIPPKVHLAGQLHLPDLRAVLVVGLAGVVGAQEVQLQAEEDAKILTL